MAYAIVSSKYKLIPMEVDTTALAFYIVDFELVCSGALARGISWH